MILKAKHLAVWNTFRIENCFYQSHVTTAQRRVPSKSTRQKRKVPLLKSTKNHKRFIAETFRYQKKALSIASSEHVSLCEYLEYFRSYDILTEVGVVRKSGRKREVSVSILGGHTTKCVVIQQWCSELLSNFKDIMPI